MGIGQLRVINARDLAYQRLTIELSIYLSGRLPGGQARHSGGAEEGVRGKEHSLPVRDPAEGENIIVK